MSSPHQCDATSAAQSAANLQALLCIMWQHSLEWMWDANMIKSHFVLFNPAAVLGVVPPGLRFGDALVLIATETRNLGLHLTVDCTWLQQIRHAREAAMHAPHAARAALRSARFSFITKRNIIATYIAPAMTFGLEV